MDWKKYHFHRKQDWLAQTAYVPLTSWDDRDKIKLAEAGANCYRPEGKTGWEIRQWLEGMRCIKKHGVCAGCQAHKICK